MRTYIIPNLYKELFVQEYINRCFTFLSPLTTAVLSFAFLLPGVKLPFFIIITSLCLGVREKKEIQYTLYIIQPKVLPQCLLLSRVSTLLTAHKSHAYKTYCRLSLDFFFLRVKMYRVYKTIVNMIKFYRPYGSSLHETKTSPIRLGYYFFSLCREFCLITVLDTIHVMNYLKELRHIHSKHLSS